MSDDERAGDQLRFDVAVEIPDRLERGTECIGAFFTKGLRDGWAVMRLRDPHHHLCIEGHKP